MCGCARRAGTRARRQPPSASWPRRRRSAGRTAGCGWCVTRPRPALAGPAGDLSGPAGGLAGAAGSLAGAAEGLAGAADGLAGAAGGLRVSLSHSRMMAAAAVTSIGPVGVDLEPVRPVDALALARRWFLEAEAAWLALLPSGQRDEAFLGLWTQKEAIAKALGTGLRGGAGLRQPVRLGPPRQVSLPLVRRPARPALRLAAAGGRPGLAVTAAALADGALEAGGFVLAVACVGAGAAGAAVTVRLAPPEPPVR